MANIIFDPEKLKELILYVAGKSFEDPSFGATKMNKILFFADFLSYAESGNPITGAEYQKLDHGPAPRQILKLIQDLENNREAVYTTRDHHGYVQKKLVPLREPNLSVFLPEEIALIDRLLEVFRSANASSLTAFSHDYSFGWQAVELGETIPYESIFISTDEPMASDFKRGQEVARELKLA